MKHRDREIPPQHLLATHGFMHDKQHVKNKRPKKEFHYMPTRLSHFIITPTSEPQSSTSDYRDLHMGELTHMARSTIDTLMKSDLRGKVCPYFIDLKISPDIAAYSPAHCFNTYLPKVQSEKQHILQFHIVGHGSPMTIAGSIWQEGLTAQQFASQFINMLKTNDPDDILRLKSRPFHVTFHSCNTAYSDTNGSMTLMEIDETVKKQTFIGQFHSCLREQGYENVITTGYRGFYMHTQNHKATLITFDQSGDSLSYPAENSCFTLENNLITKRPKKVCLFSNIDVKDLYSFPNTLPDELEGTLMSV